MDLSAHVGPNHDAVSGTWPFGKGLLLRHPVGYDGRIKHVAAHQTPPSQEGFTESGATLVLQTNSHHQALTALANKRRVDVAVSRLLRVPSSCFRSALGQWHRGVFGLMKVTKPPEPPPLPYTTAPRGEFSS